MLVFCSSLKDRKGKSNWRRARMFTRLHRYLLFVTHPSLLGVDWRNERERENNKILLAAALCREEMFDNQSFPKSKAIAGAESYWLGTRTEGTKWLDLFRERENIADSSLYANKGISTLVGPKSPKNNQVKGNIVLPFSIKERKNWKKTFWGRSTPKASERKVFYPQYTLGLSCFPIV